MRSSFLKDLIKSSELIAERCPGDVQLADISTEILPAPDLTSPW